MIQTSPIMPEKRIFAKAGHICMICGFKATTKNKYRELQDHLSRRHFHERIKVEGGFSLDSRSADKEVKAVTPGK